MAHRNLLIMFTVLVFICWVALANQDDGLKKAKELREALRIAKAMKSVKSTKSINKPKFTPEVADQIAELTKGLTGWSSEKFEVPPPATNEEPTHETPTERAKRLRRQATYAKLLKEVKLPEEIRQNELFQEVLRKVTQDEDLKNKIEQDANRVKDKENLKYVPKFVLEKQAEEEQMKLQMQFLQAIENEMEKITDGSDKDDQKPLPLCRNQEDDSAIYLASGVKLKKKESIKNVALVTPHETQLSNSVSAIHVVFGTIQFTVTAWNTSTQLEKIIIGSLLVTSLFVLLGIIYRAFSSFTLQGVFTSLFFLSAATSRDPFQLIAENGYLLHDILLALFALSFSWMLFLNFLCLSRFGLSNLSQFIGCVWVVYHYFGYAYHLHSKMLPGTYSYGVYTGIMFLMSILSLIQLVDSMLDTQHNKTEADQKRPVEILEPVMIEKREQELLAEDPNNNNSTLTRRKKQKHRTHSFFAFSTSVTRAEAQKYLSKLTVHQFVNYHQSVMGQEVSKSDGSEQKDGGSISLNIDTGYSGGAPPHRKFSVTGSAKVQVNLDDTYDEMIQKIKAVILIEGEPNNIQLDRTKTVRENGLKNGSKLVFWNGAMD